MILWCVVVGVLCQICPDAMISHLVCVCAPECQIFDRTVTPAMASVLTRFDFLRSPMPQQKRSGFVQGVGNVW